MSAAGTGARGHGGTGVLRRGLHRASVPLCLYAVLSGCAYYNAMYNAKRWARQAERSERAGRLAESQERWRTAMVHAESVLSRHPRSRWADDAVMIRGRALVQLQAHSEAIGLLDQALPGVTDARVRAAMLLDLGRANLALRRYAEAELALDGAIAVADGRVRAEALLVRGRVRLAQGRAAEALEDLRASSARGARFDQARAALAGGDGALAAAIADSALGERPFAEDRWQAFLDTLADAGFRDAAGALAWRIAARGEVGIGTRARVLLRDGDRRLAATDTAGADLRWREALRLVPDSAEARAARVRLLQVELGAMADTAGLDPLRRDLTRIADQGGEPGAQARELLRLLALADTLGTGDAARADAAWLLRGELLRDSLRSTRLAAHAFAAMAARFPESPWAARALVAAIAAGHPSGDSLRALLAGPFAASPYAAAAAGRADADAAYAVLEDSLLRVQELLAGVAPAAEARTAVPGADEEIETRRRRARPTTQRTGPGQTPPRPPGRVPEP